MPSRAIDVSKRLILRLNGDRNGNRDAYRDDPLPLDDDFAVSSSVASAVGARRARLGGLPLVRRLNVNGDDLDGIIWWRRRPRRERHGLHDRRRRRRGLGLWLRLWLGGQGDENRRRRRWQGRPFDDHRRRRRRCRDDARDAAPYNGIVGLRVVEIEPLLFILSSDCGSDVSDACGRIAG